MHQCSDGVSADVQRRAFDTLCDLIKGNVTGEDAVSQVRDLLGTAQPADQILSILQMPPDPIPCSEPAHEKIAGSPRQKAHAWSAYEDQRLVAAIHRFGVDNWYRVCSFVGNGRSPSQCAQRWNRGLNPYIFKGPWACHEEAELLRLVAELGTKAWRRIAATLGKRCDVQCRYHYQQLQKGKGSGAHAGRAQSRPIPVIGATGQEAIGGVTRREREGGGD